jgi:hypothetical protein
MYHSDRREISMPLQTKQIQGQLYMIHPIIRKNDYKSAVGSFHLDQS